VQDRAEWEKMCVEDLKSYLEGMIDSIFGPVQKRWIEAYFRECLVLHVYGCIHTHTCIYVYGPVHFCVCVCICIYVCIYIYIYIYIYICLHVYMYTQKCTWARSSIAKNCFELFMCAFMYLHVMCVHLCIYTVHTDGILHIHTLKTYAAAMQLALGTENVCVHARHVRSYTHITRIDLHNTMMCAHTRTHAHTHTQIQREHAHIAHKHSYKIHPRAHTSYLYSCSLHGALLGAWDLLQRRLAGGKLYRRIRTCTTTYSRCVLVQPASNREECQWRRLAMPFGFPAFFRL
jgi:hypothetical protein